MTSLMNNSPPRQAEHTPGPWEVAEGKSYQNGVPIEIELFVRRGDDDVAIASEISNPEQEDSRTPDATARANARLIAAAPDMYAALKDIFGFLRSSGYDTRIVGAAIAKAEGRDA